MKTSHKWVFLLEVAMYASATAQVPRFQGSATVAPLHARCGGASCRETVAPSGDESLGTSGMARRGAHGGRVPFEGRLGNSANWLSVLGLHDLVPSRPAFIVWQENRSERATFGETAQFPGQAPAAQDTEGCTWQEKSI